MEIVEEKSESGREEMKLFIRRISRLEFARESLSSLRSSGREFLAKKGVEILNMKQDCLGNLSRKTG